MLTRMYRAMKALSAGQAVKPLLLSITAWTRRPLLASHFEASKTIRRVGEMALFNLHCLSIANQRYVQRFFC